MKITSLGASWWATLLVCGICFNGLSQGVDSSALGIIGKGLLPKQSGVGGWPSAYEAQQILQSKVRDESGGGLKLVSFKDAGSPWSRNYATNRFYGISFDAEIEFLRADGWSSKLGGKSVSFRLNREFSGNSASDSNSFSIFSPQGELFVFAGYALFSTNGGSWSSEGFGIAPPKRVSTVLSDQCADNLKAIGFAFRQWALDHDDKFPFNAATNSGGTMEYCARAKDGFDANGAMHVRVMSNELNNVVILLCPSDSLRRGAAGFSTVGADNISYKFRSGQDVTESHAEEILATCPLHGHICYCDGSVKKAAKR